MGAGASHDVRWHPSTGIIEIPALNVPLTTTLFDGARGIGLEASLRHYAHHPTSETLRERYKHVPPYLRDLLWQCCNDTLWPSGYIRLVAQLLGEHSYEVLFLVLNYDDLLEKALRLLEPDRYTFENMGDYFADRPAKVVKIHGSINWFIPLRGKSNTWDECVRRLNVLDRPNESDIRVIDRIGNTRISRQPDALWSWGEDPWVYPVLTAPLAGKDLDNIVCPDSHREFAEPFLSTCQRFLVIGSSGTDDDLMKLLDRAVPADRSMKLVHVVGKKDADNTRDQFKQGVNAFREDATFSEFYKGFQEYLVDPAFQSFCDGQWYYDPR